MIEADELADALAAALPRKLRPQAEGLAAQLVGATYGEPGRAAPELRAALAALAGQEIALSSGTLTFGAGNQFGDVTIGDVVSGDKLTVQIAVGQARGIRLAIAIATTTLLATLGAITAILWPRVADPGPMSGLFNVAVAEFGQVGPDGKVTTWESGARLSRSISERLAQEFAAAPGLGSVVQVRHERVGVITGRTSGERAERARLRAEALNAHVLIYGLLDRSGGQARFVPQFYISEEGFANAAELVGDERLGSPMALPNANDLSTNLELNESLRPRTQALTLFAVGLAYFVSHNEERASALFEEAVNVQGWNNPEGKEVIYLFLGSARKASDAPDSLAKAQDAYEAAIRLNPEYARGYIGLGNVAYEQFRRDGNKSFELISQAIAWYERAAHAKAQPSQAYADVKILISLGNGYLARAQLGQPNDFAVAEQYFQVVVEAYQAGARDIDAYTSQAQFGLGVIAERCDHDQSAALQHYMLARDLAGADNGLRRQAEIQMQAVEAATPTP